MRDYVCLAPNHHAVTSLQAPHTAAGSDVDVVDSPGCQLFGAPYVIYVIGIATVNEDVVRFKIRQEIRYGTVHDGCGYHQPNCPRFVQPRSQILQGETP